jgi:hypothetical protein
MKADIYKPVITQDSIGTVSKTYTFEKTVDCFVRVDIRTGSGDNSTAVKIKEYINYLYSQVKMKSNEVVPMDRVIVKVRNDSGVIFLENQDPSSAGGFENSTIFESKGSTPIFNFDGSILEYETMLSRKEIQKM